MNETRTLAEFAVQLESGSIPEEVRRRAAALVLDQLACQIAGVQLPWSQRIADAIRPLTAPGKSSVVMDDAKLAADGAAFLNSAFGHSNESDDTHLKSPNHPGAVIIPAVLALAEERGIGGDEALDAIIVGYEVMLRVSQAVSPHLITQGHHPPPAAGPFGVAAAVGRLLSFDADLTQQAMAIAGSYSAGLLEYTQTGGSVKRLHCAIPSQAGIRAALLAESGVTGPPTVLEGTRGFLAVFSPAYDVAWLTKDLGKLYLVLETAVKNHSCCYLIHPALDAIQELRAQYDFAPDDVDGIKVRTRSQALVHHVGAITEPEDILGAQFSMGFALGLMLVKGGCGFWDFFNADLKDPDILRIAHAADLELVDADEGAFVTGLEVEVRLKHGSVVTTSKAHARGEPEDPLTNEDIAAKFEEIAGPVLGDERTAEVIKRVLAIDDEASIGDLFALLREE